MAAAAKDGKATAAAESIASSLWLTRGLVYDLH
jgi:hypothetical protein